MHRTDLLRVLQRRAAQLGVEFIFGQSFQSLQEDEHCVKVQLSSGVIVEADVVLGADGAFSTLPLSSGSLTAKQVSTPKSGRPSQPTKESTPSSPAIAHS